MSPFSALSPISAFTAPRARHLLRGAAILSATVLACSPVAPDAHASTGPCASDPHITYQNGDEVDLSTLVGADPNVFDPSNVSGVNYVVHSPAGSPETLEADTAVLGLQRKDNISYKYDLPAGSHRYNVSVKVTTTPSGVPVTALLTLLGVQPSSDTVSGASPKWLTLTANGG